jgi:prepilin-type N-terminal cleavage/methylation domain-containing protein
MIRRHVQAGFTLVELLAALAIAAILVLPLADMLRVGADSARTARATLDLGADARFALGRIVAEAAQYELDAAGPAGAGADPASWLSAVAYTLAGTDLVETKAGNSRVIASNVTAFRLTAPEVVAGLPLLGIELTLSADGQTVSRTRIVRMRIKEKP